MNDFINQLLGSFNCPLRGMKLLVADHRRAWQASLHPDPPNFPSQPWRSERKRAAPSCLQGCNLRDKVSLMLFLPPGVPRFPDRANPARILERQASLSSSFQKGCDSFPWIADMHRVRTSQTEMIRSHRRRQAAQDFACLSWSQSF